MGYRVRGSRFGGGRPSQARPISGDSRRSPGPRARLWLGWVGAATAVIVVAFLVGRAGSEPGLPSPTPSPSAVGSLPIVFGTALDPASGEAVQLTDRFRSGDTISYSVSLPAAPGVGTILVEIARLSADGEAVVQEPSEQGIVATSAVMGFTFAVPTSDLLASWGAGDYVMRIYLPGAGDPFAAGRFTLVETPQTS